MESKQSSNSDIRLSTSVALSIVGSGLLSAISSSKWPNVVPVSTAILCIDETITRSPLVTKSKFEFSK